MSIIITIKNKQGWIYVTIENHKRKHSADVASHKIGLMTVKTLVERNGGSVDIEQNVTRFSIQISLPQTESPEFGKDV
ncbi:GHKL domain-containing protein [Intestinimonas sp. HCP28S3_D6]|uniref:GHKL domain-containing protein n=1 Tax=Intestinimonas sp. HCP28S3_D6 TaxID=3438942 RepID=UPI003F8A59DB